MNVNIQRSESLPFNYDNVIVTIRDHSIPTLVTNNGVTASNWLSQVQNSFHPNLPNIVIVGFCANYQLDYPTQDISETPYNILQLYLESQCLLFHFSDSETYINIIEALNNLFTDSRVLAIGMKMKSVTNKMERDHGIKVNQYHDLNRLAIKGLNGGDLNLMEYNLDQLLEKVFAGEMSFEKPPVKLKWFEGDEWVLSDDLVKYATLEPFFCYEVGARLLELVDSHERESVVSKKKKKKKKEEKKARKREEKKTRKKKKEKLREMNDLMMID